MKFFAASLALLASTAMALPTITHGANGTSVDAQQPTINLVNKLIGLGLQQLSDDELEADLKTLAGDKEIPAVQLEAMKSMLSQAGGFEKRDPLHGDCSFVGVFTGKCFLRKREVEVVEKREPLHGDCSFVGVFTGKCFLRKREDEVVKRREPLQSRCSLLGFFEGACDRR